MNTLHKLTIAAVCVPAWISADQFSKALFKNILTPGDVISFGAERWLRESGHPVKWILCFNGRWKSPAKEQKQ